MSAATLPTMLAALGTVLGIIWLLQAILRRRISPTRSGPGRLAIVQSLALDPKRRMTLVRCDGRTALLITGGGQDLFLGWLGEAAQADTGSAGP